MRYRFALLLFVFVPMIALAAPIPKEDNALRMRRVYGETIDPDKDCKFELTGEKLRIKIPGKHHSLNANPGLDNAPRSAKEIEGDFTAIVRVTFPIRAREGLKADQNINRFANGGLVVWSGGEMVRFVRRESGVGQRQVERFHRQWDIPGNSSPNTVAGAIAKHPESAYLRLERKGQKVVTSYSRDGKTWTIQAPDVDVGWEKKVKVGIIAENGYSAPFEVTFEEYKLTQPEK